MCAHAYGVKGAVVGVAAVVTALRDSAFNTLVGVIHYNYLLRLIYIIIVPLKRENIMVIFSYRSKSFDLTVTLSSSPDLSTIMVEPAVICPVRESPLSLSSKSFCMARFKGRAPYFLS